MNVVVMAFIATTNAFSLPPGLLSALCYVESKHTTGAINKNDGGSDSFGICQIKYDTAKMVGYTGTAAKLHTDAKVNIFWSGAYLKTQITRYDGNIPKAIAAYNSGSYKTNRQGEAVNRKYVNAVIKAWESGK